MHHVRDLIAELDDPLVTDGLDPFVEKTLSRVTDSNAAIRRVLDEVEGRCGSSLPDSTRSELRRRCRLAFETLHQDDDL